MGAHTYEEDPVTSPLGGVEPGLTLGTIEEAKEGSTGDESEAETITETQKGDEAGAEVTEKEENEKEEEAEEQDDEERVEEGECEACLDTWESHPDVDKGWAWVILIAIFGVFVITSGLLNTTGMFYVQMLGEYGHSRSYTAWMGSLINAFFMLGGPFSFMFIQHFGCRAALIFGSIVMAVGYLASAFTTSLESLFFTYGVVVACGMSCAYSGQIAALNQYFHKRHSIATSTAMLGIGLGMFFLSSLTEYSIKEFGWRGAFIWNAGLSLHIVVFGSLIYPLRPIVQDNKEPLDIEENLPKPSRPLKTLKSSKSRMFMERSFNNRSFSSLRLSAEASYLSHSQLSLKDSHRHLNLRSNQHSFCSKGSNLVIGSIRSNGPSFCMRDSRVELSHFDLRSNQFSIHHRDSYAEFGLHSNAHSFCSRRDSQTGLNGIKSNPHSFIHHHHILDGEVDSLKGSYGGGQARFMLREGDCDLGCCVLEEEDDCPSVISEVREQRSFSVMVYQLKDKLHATLVGFTKKSENNVFMEGRFWLLNVSYFFAMVGSICFLIIYKDFAVFKDVGEYYTMALSSIGVGDLVGRMSTGILLSIYNKRVNPVLTFSLAMLFCSAVIFCHAFIKTSTHFLVLTSLFGIVNGSQNVLTAVTPTMVFGREMLATVFGYILFFGGVGALIGAPTAGFIVDKTDSFDGVVAFSSLSLLAGSILMFFCFLANRSGLNKERQQQQQQQV